MLSQSCNAFCQLLCAFVTGFPADCLVDGHRYGDAHHRRPSPSQPIPCSLRSRSPGSGSGGITRSEQHRQIARKCIFTSLPVTQVGGLAEPARRFCNAPNEIGRFALRVVVLAMSFSFVPEIFGTTDDGVTECTNSCRPRIPRPGPCLAKELDSVDRVCCQECRESPTGRFRTQYLAKVVDAGFNVLVGVRNPLFHLLMVGYPDRLCLFTTNE
jgi:hypothetical protein